MKMITGLVHGRWWWLVITSPFVCVARRVCVWVCCAVMLGCAQGIFAGSAAAWELPEGRVYEMVSPPYKGDYGISPQVENLGVAPDAESFVFSSLGTFAGAPANFLFAPYIARRTSDGWVTYSTNPPPADGRLPGPIPDYTPDLSRQISVVSAEKGGLLSGGETAGLTLGDLRAAEISFTQAWPLPDRPASFPAEAGKAGFYKGASADLSHLVFKSAPEGGLYQIAGVGGLEPQEEALAVTGQPDGPGGTILPECPAPFQQSVELERRPHAISDDGSVIFFRRCSAVPYVRMNGSATFELSPAGELWGASEDGSKAFFTNGAGELSMDAIDSEPGHEAITETVPITTGAPASVVISSDDGSHVYFTSSGVLAGANAQGHSPEPGASNLYAYDSVTRNTAFIAVTPVHTSEFGGYEAQTTPDGQLLVFTSESQLTPDATGTHPAVYRYDTETGGLVRVSLGENGHDNNGNDNAYGASIAAPIIPSAEDRSLVTWRLGTRALSDDGSTIVFSTAAPLSPRASNGNVNVYVWHEGRVGMISTGLSKTSDELPVVSQSGRDIFFLTSQNILPQDSDGLLDVYDARIGGGFPEPNVAAGDCSGDTCQGPPSVPSLLGAPASATFSGLGNPAPAVTPKVKPKRCKKGYVKKKGKCVKRHKARKARNNRRAT